MSTPSLRQRLSERSVRVKIPRAELPAARAPPAKFELSGHDGDVGHVVAVPGTDLLATASEGAKGLRIFSLTSPRGAPIHTCANTFGFNSRGLAAIAPDVVAAGAADGRVTTWTASTGAVIEVCNVGRGGYVTAMAAMGPGRFVAETSTDALVFMAHDGGRRLREVGRGTSSYNGWIFHVACRGDVVVVASGDKAAAVWSAATCEKVATLSGHRSYVACAALSDKFIATGSVDKSMRLYENGKKFGLVKVIEGVHANWVYSVAFVNEDLLMSASDDKRLAFTTVLDGKVVARADVGIAMCSTAITPGGRIACVGRDGNAAVVMPPENVADAVRTYADVAFSAPLLAAAGRDSPRLGEAAAALVRAGSSTASASVSASVSASCAPEFPEMVETSSARPRSVASEDRRSSPSLAGQTIASAAAAAANSRIAAAAEAEAEVASSAFTRLDVSDDECVFDMKALKASASNAEEIEGMNCEDLSKTVAAAMVNFEEDSRARLITLANCLRTAFGLLCIGGDSIVSFPEKDLLEMLVDALLQDKQYIALGDNATRNFEWRLQRFLQRLRWYAVCSACGSTR